MAKKVYNNVRVEVSGGDIEEDLEALAQRLSGMSSEDLRQVFDEMIDDGNENSLITIAQALHGRMYNYIREN